MWIECTMESCVVRIDTLGMKVNGAMQFGWLEFGCVRGLELLVKMVQKLCRICSIWALVVGSYSRLECAR